jgi:large subunit ribosomal protein L13
MPRLPLCFTLGYTYAVGSGDRCRSPIEPATFFPFNLTQTTVFDILSVRIFAEIAISVGVMSTYFPSGKGLAENRKWVIVDAKGKTVGRLATEVARILSGKNNPAWTPFMDMGEHCIVINARHAVFTGAKDDQKIYYRHTLYPGGLRETTVKEMFEKKPEKVIELAVRGMLPKSKLGKAMAKKLKVYPDGEHRHTAQKPEAIEI